MTEPTDERGKPKILVVEDHRETSTYLEMALSEDYEVHTAESATEALEKVKSDRFDLFLVDIALRDNIDGIELVTLLREMLEVQATPMIAMTAHQLKENRDFYLNHGFDEFLGKPFFPEELLEAIATLLENGRPHGQAHRPAPGR